ncbi:MAG: hypothetical protein QM528_02085 [Phycisphaerales bacterium]|nr:hypothetical protein [Phycisphaerales bacterium]
MKHENSSLGYILSRNDIKNNNLMGIKGGKTPVWGSCSHCSGGVCTKYGTTGSYICCYKTLDAYLDCQAGAECEPRDQDKSHTVDTCREV